MDEPQISTRAIRAHNLRHQLALLAVDLRLCRDRLARRDGDGRALLGSLLDRLDRGLERASRIAAGAPGPASEMEMDRAPLLDEIWNDFRRAGRLPAGASRLELSRPWIFPGSEDALHSLLLNLIENASAAAPEGPVQLTADGEGILVENGGEPMPEHLADALRRGIAPPPRGDRGQGLGEILRRARQLDLRIELETGTGTRIHLKRGGGPRLLLVEDDDGLRAMLAVMIRQWGFSVDEAAGFESVGQDAGPWVAAVADLGLPGEAGDLGLARLKAAHPGLRTLLLTGARERAGQAAEGVDRVLVKPGLEALRLELLELLETVR